MKEFFTIGEISKLFNINRKTLRYYDEIDLFKPSYVDEHNKYRYYSIDQFECLETIQYLKELGLTLNKIKYHLNTLNLSSIVDSLEYQNQIIEEKIKEKFQSSRQITIGSLRLDLSDGHAYLNNADTGLTRTEFSLLRLLAENQEKIFSAKELYEAVWGSCAGTDTSTVRRHIFNLRTKIGAEDTDEYDIVSVYGKGYLFTCR